MAYEISPDPTSEEVAAIMVAIEATQPGRSDEADAPVDHWRIAGRLAAVHAGERLPRGASADAWIASGRRYD